jgi:hypothetical protein
LELGAILGGGSSFSIGHPVLKHSLVGNGIVVVEQFPLTLLLVMGIKPLVSQLTLIVVNPISVLLPIQEIPLVPALWVAQLASACVLAVLVQKTLIHIFVLIVHPFHHAFFLFVILVNSLE